MKMKQVSVIWEKKVEVTVYVPEDMDDRSIHRVMEQAEHQIDQWDAEWVTFVNKPEAVDVPDDECVLVEATSRGGNVYLTADVASRFAADDAFLLDDHRSGIVNPEDATWWLAQTQE